MANQLYSVPSALVFRSWASNADPDAVIKRRLLLKNDSQRPLCFRLSLPQHPAFQVSGSLVPDVPGDVCNVSDAYLEAVLRRNGAAAGRSRGAAAVAAAG